ncbi:MAG: hypothetical protein AMXMBFR13_40580 [Phycisphaerae bacterium]
MNSMTKIAAVALLAMVPSAFGAVTLALVDGDGNSIRNTPVLAGQTLTLNLNLGIEGPEDVAGYTFFLTSDVPGAFRITGRTINNDVLADATTSNTILLNASFNELNPTNARDVGATGPASGIPELDALFDPGANAVQTIVLTAQVDVPAAQIMITGGSWNNQEGINTDPDQMLGYTIVPEPVSALLLVLGGLFVTRRRVA